MTLKNNNKGFSLVELLTVIAIMGVAVSLVGASFLSLYRARSQRAAETLDAVISQCKIDTMSGLNCEVRVELDDGDYYARLYRFDEADDGSISETVYKSEKLASDSLTVSAGGASVGTDSVLNIRFNRSTGAIASAGCGSVSNIFGSGVTAVITMASTGTHTITLYRTTGEHVLDA